MRTQNIIVFALLGIATATVGGCGNVKTTEALEKLTPVAVPASPSDSSRVWQTAFNRAVELHNSEKFTEASYYFANAIGTAPGNYKIIDAYTKTMLELAKEDASVLPILEGFLTAQIPLVRVEDVEKVLTLLKSVRRKIDEGTAVAEQPAQTDPKLDELLEQIKNGSFQLPDDTAGLQTAAENAVDLLDHLTARKTENDIIKQVEATAALLQRTLNFNALQALLQECKESVTKSMEVSASVAEYQVHECEQIVRQMIALHLPEKTGIINKEINESLRELVEKIAEKKSRELWAETAKELSKKAEERSAIKEKKEGKGVCQLRLEVLEQEAMLVQNILPMLSGDSMKEAMAKRDELGKEAERLSHEQSKQYNNWAIQEIQQCLNKSREGVGLFANGDEGRKTISAALIAHIGSIDRRFLTNEVARALSEVENKYLAPNQLNPVKNAESSKEQGNILYTLEQMYEQKKKQIREF